MAPAHGAEPRADPEDGVARDPRTIVRRANREIRDEAWLAAMLEAAPTGVLATAPGGQPFALPNLFIFDAAARAIYLHSGAGGRTSDVVDAPQPATFVVHELGRIVPGPSALDFTAEYASVVVFGTLAPVQDPGAKAAILARWYDKYYPEWVSGRDYTPFGDADVARTAVYRLAIEAWSGKRNRQPDEAPGARGWTGGPLLDLDPGAAQGQAAHAT